MNAAFSSKLEKLFDPAGKFATAIREHITSRRSEALGSFDFNREVFWWPISGGTRTADLIDEHVITKLPQPLFFSRDDLLETLHAQLGGSSTTEDFESSWKRVLAFTVGSVSGLFEETKTFDLGLWAAPDRETAKEEDDPGLGWLWTSECEHFLLDAEWNEGKSQARLHGNVTPRALDFAVAQLADVCQMAANTVRFARSGDGTTPSFSRLVEARGKLVFKSCLDSFFRHSRNKMSEMEKSQHNAVQLLLEADKTTNDSISVSLSVAAAEALLCDGTAIAEQFSQRGAVLLETERHQRPGATEQLKKLYRERSRTLHGDNVAGTSSMRQAARRLASGILAAVIEWQDHRRKNRGCRRTKLPSGRAEGGNDEWSSGRGCCAGSALLPAKRVVMSYR